MPLVAVFVLSWVMVQGQSAVGKLIEYPFEDQFEQGVPRDFMQDKNGVYWFLTKNELYYMLQDGMFKYEGLQDIEIANPKFIDMGDGVVYVISQKSFVRVESPA